MHNDSLVLRAAVPAAVLSLALLAPVLAIGPAHAAAAPAPSSATSGPAAFIGPVATARSTKAPLVRRYGPRLPVRPVSTAPVAAPRAEVPTASPSPSPTAAPALPPSSGSSRVADLMPRHAGGRGPQESYVPVGTVRVAVGELTQALLDTSPAGTRFVLEPGVHRLTRALTPRSGQALLGTYGAIVSGAKPLTGWVASGGAWYVGGQVQRLPVNDVGMNPCASGTLCQAAEDVFVDDAPVRQVATRAELRPDTFWFDTAANRIWLGSDPAGRRVETTVTPQAIVDARNVVLRNLVVEKFGNSVQKAAVHGADLTIENSVIRLNHGTGALVYGGVLRGSVIDRNGQLGVGGGGSGMLVEDNEIVGNNTMGYSPDWEAGGTKWAFSSGLVVRDNWVHHNDGQGLWTDIDNTGTTYEGNLVEANTGIGIFHEISYDAVIRNNTVRGNGTRKAYFNSRVGINVTNSSSVQVLGNVVSDNGGGQLLAVQDPRSGAGRLGPRELRAVVFSGNTVSGGGWNGMWVYDTVPDRAAYFTTRGISFTANRYAFNDPAARNFIGGDAALHEQSQKTWTQWRATGQDAGSASS